MVDQQVSGSKTRKKAKQQMNKKKVNIIYLNEKHKNSHVDEKNVKILEFKTSRSQ